MSPGPEDGREDTHGDPSGRVERERTLERLHEVTRELLGAESRQEVIDITTRGAREALGYTRSLVRLVSDDGRELRPVAVTDEARELLGDRPVYPVGEGSAGRAYAADETLVFDDVRTLDDGYDRGDARASMFVPLGDHGVLSIGAREPGAFDATDIHFAEIFAANVEAALTRVEGTQARKRQNERLEAFARIVSHDIRNPLNVVDGRLELVRERRDDEDLERAAEAIDRAFELVDDLLTVTREGGDVPAGDLEPVLLAVAADRCWRNVSTEDATLVVDAEGVVRADRSRLAQLLENLMRNSVDHGSTGNRTPSGDRVEHGDVTVTVGDLDGGFYVADDGPGIPETRRDRVFEAGYSTARGGTGLGLEIVRQVADAHGWEVGVAESRDGGARIEVTGVRTVPADDADDAA